MPKKVEEEKEAPAVSGGAKEVKGNVMYIICYLFTWLSGLILYLTEGKTNKEMRFHAIQAIGIGLTMILCWFFFWLLFIPVLIAIGLWLYGLYVGYTAYSTGERKLVPVIGEYALKYAEKEP